MTDSMVIADVESLENLDVISGEQQLLEMLVGAIACYNYRVQWALSNFKMEHSGSRFIGCPQKTAAILTIERSPVIKEKYKKLQRIFKINDYARR